jgi:hypothetical protein
MLIVAEDFLGKMRQQPIELGNSGRAIACRMQSCPYVVVQEPDVACLEDWIDDCLVGRWMVLQVVVVFDRIGNLSSIACRWAQFGASNGFLARGLAPAGESVELVAV